MQCHKCPHRADVEAGKYRQVPYEATPCAPCQPRECSLHTLAVDTDRPVYLPGREGAECHVDVPFPEEAEAARALVPLHVLEELVCRLLSLPAELRDVVCWRFMGLSYPQIAQSQGITAAGAEQRHVRAMRMFPELRTLFPAKTRRAKTRRRAGARH